LKGIIAYFKDAKVITGEAFWEPDYFKESLSDTRFSRRNIHAGLLSLAVAVFAILYCWGALPVAITGMLFVGVLSMSVTWARAVRTHHKMRTLFANAPPEELQREVLKVATTEAIAGPWGVFTSTLYLFMAILLIMGHYHRQPWQDKAKAWLTTNASAASTSVQDAQPLAAPGTQMFPAKLKHRVQPVYPKDAKIMGIEGTVRLRAIIEKDGSVDHIEYISGPKELADAAIAAVRQWVYEPTIWNGRIVTVKTKIDIVFKLNK